MEKEVFESVVSKYRAQIGETVWHAFTGDELIESKSTKFFTQLEGRLKSEYGGEHFKVLELAPSKNFVGCLIAEKFNADVTIMDLSKQALIDGKAIADAKGFTKTIKRVAADFHNLPFSSASFDFVYMAGAIHHSKVPEDILREIARVLKPGGLFESINEPCKREFSLYSFSSNRGVLSKFEQILLDEGVLGIFSYPVNGSRPEDLFGIVENWSISIETFLNSQRQYFDVISEEYEWGPLTDFEKLLLDSREKPAEELKNIVRSKLHEVYQKAEPHLGNKERAMGFFLPDEEEVLTMMDTVIGILKKPDFNASSIDYDRNVTNIFGSRIKNMLYRRNDAPAKDKELVELVDDGIVSTMPLTYQGATLDLTKHLLPSIQDSNATDSLRKIFGEADWDIITEADGVIISCTNLKPEPVVRLDGVYENVVLCIRFYAIELEDPYTVELCNGDNSLDKLTICNSETRCSILPLERLEGDVVFKLRDENNNPVDKDGYIRVGVFQLLQILD